MRLCNVKRFLVAASLAVSISAVLFAEPVLAYAITRGYASADSQLVPGMAVALSDGTTGDQSKVERGSTENADKIVGIATTVNDSLVTIASGKSQAYVENEGGVSAYLTDVNGTPNKGDLLTISPLKGILMKADSSSTVIVAVAEEDFVADKAEKYPLSGGSKTALIEKLRVNLDRRGASSQNAPAQSSLEKLSYKVVGKDIGALRVVIALVVFFLVMLTEGAILYGTISSSITSLGRNPMAHGIIRREVLRVLWVVGLVLGVGLIAIYAILWI